MNLDYSILDPTGNITILVESPVEPGRRSIVAARLMQLHPEAEQTGFVTFQVPASSAALQIAASLSMAGGEFCGNATMSTAALWCLRHDVPGENQENRRILLQVSGAADPVEVLLTGNPDRSFKAGIHMPPARRLSKERFSFGTLSGELTLVRMEGISHIIIEPESVFFSLKRNSAEAEKTVREWCLRLGLEGLGLMFLEKAAGQACVLTPLVYVPGSETIFWENSCASGTSAVGMYLAEKNGTFIEQELQEPGGLLRVTTDPARKETWLYGTVKLAGHYSRWMQMED